MFLEKIRQVYPDLTKNQKRLADFIATSYQEAAFMTASRLAEDFSLSESTVVRFAQRIGYHGYPELVQDMQEVVHQDLRKKIKVLGASEEFSDFGRLLNSEIANLQRCANHVAPDLVLRALAMLQQADKVLILGQGLMSPLAQLFAASLRAIGLCAESPPSDPMNIALTLSGTDIGCVVVGLSAITECEEIANALQYASQKGLGTLALTTSGVAPCAQAADVAIVCPSSDDFPIPSITALTMMIDTLLQSLASKNTDSAKISRLGEFEEARRFILGKPVGSQ
jgi:DNA-binding MurR/RpiR family transcriptional regulator